MHTSAVKFALVPHYVEAGAFDEWCMMCDATPSVSCDKLDKHFFVWTLSPRVASWLVWRLLYNQYKERCWTTR